MIALPFHIMRNIRHAIEIYVELREIRLIQKGRRLSVEKFYCYY